SARAVGRTGRREIELLAGYASRAFGALDFYAPFPSFEHTQALFAGLKLRADLSDKIVIEQRLGGRRHRDRFTLVRDDPDLYRNDHATRRASAETRLLVDAGYGLSVATGAEAVYEDIRSDGIRGGTAGPALGDHERRRASASLEVTGRHLPLRWSLGARLDAWSGIEPTLSRSAAASLDLGGGILLRASSGTVFRVPTFTELHYEDPANRGDPGLSAERGWSWDAGGEVRRGPWTVVWEYFTRYEHDLIDWARPAAASDEPWRVMNIATGEVRGWTQAYRLDTPRGDVVYLNHSYLDRSRSLPDDHVAKYGFLAPRHLLSAGVAVSLPHHMQLTPQARYRERSDGEGHLAADLRATFRWTAWRLHLDATNLFDRAYEEVPGIPLPGRRVTLTTAFVF
ncbi:TonB-dependent receptor, partial [bacterium]|nr:TonB-dependent receptor [bacterium]